MDRLVAPASVRAARTARMGGKNANPYRPVATELQSRDEGPSRRAIGNGLVGRLRYCNTIIFLGGVESSHHALP